MTIESDPETEVAPRELRSALIAVLTQNGMAADSAAIIADVITQAEIDGSRSHGIQRLAGYIGSLRSGWVDGKACPQVVDRAPGVIEVDAGNGFAQIASLAGRASLIEKCRANGVAIMVVRNSHHLAGLWPDVEPLASKGLIALTMVNTRSRMVVWGGHRKALGTNPIAFACPRQDGLPLVWDQASSVLSQGEVLLRSAAQEPLPKGAGVDSEGVETENPDDVLNGGALLPFGGAKGAGIAFMVEILAAALTGSRFGFQDTSANFPGAQTSNAGQFILAIDPARAGGNLFFPRVEELIQQLVDAGASRMPSQNRYRRRAQAESSPISVNTKHWRAVLNFMYDNKDHEAS